MAIDNRLQVFNEEGQSVDYDIMATDVKFADGKDLPTKLDEMEDEIGEGGYTPPPGGIPKTDLAPAVQQTLDDVANKVDKVTGKGLSSNDYTDADKSKLGNLKPVATTGSYNDLTDKPTIPTVPTMDSTPTQGNTTHTVSSDGVAAAIAAAIAQAGGQVTVTTNGDGTVTIHSGENDYTINLNHTHENMAKLVITDEEPSDPARDTIYALVDDATTPTAIQSLWIAGLEFVGGVPDTGMPMVAKPNTLRPLNLGNNTGSGVTALVDVKARNLNYNGSTDGLTVSVGQNSGLLLSYDQTVDATSITIPQLAAETGCQITVKYTGSGALDDGALVFSHDNAVLVSVVVVVVVAPVQVAGVKLTGTQWLQTDYHVNANTKVVMRATFATNSFTQTTSNRYFYLSCREKTSGDAGNFIFYVGIEQTNPNGPFNFCGGTGGSSAAIQSIARASMLTPNSTIEIYGTTMSFIPNGGSAITNALSPAISSMANPMVIGYYISNGEPRIFNTLDLTIHELTISEGSETKRHYVPATLQGVPGLHDTVTDAFISSMVEGEPLVVVQ